jgi:hypothetical protein
MKHFIIISALINSIFGQFVIERIITEEDFGFSSINLNSKFRLLEHLDKDIDFNNDGSPENLVLDSNEDYYYILDIKNTTIIDSILNQSAWNSVWEFISFSNITCLSCNDLIMKPNSGGDFFLGDLNNQQWHNVGYEADLFTIGDVDDDGLIEIVMYAENPPRLEIWGNGVTTVSTATSISPSFFLLNQNYPNPFNPVTSISYQVQLSGDVNLNIYDILGNRVKTLIDEPKVIGDYEVRWDGTNQLGERLSSGQYFYQLKVGDFVSTKKMVLLK